MKVGDRVRIKGVVGSPPGSFFHKIHFNNIGILQIIISPEFSDLGRENYLVREDNDITMSSIWCTEVELYSEPIILPKELFEI